jgi:putative transposase
VLDVSTNGFYAWRLREPSARDLADDDLAEVILGIYAFSRETYGRPRIHAELHQLGFQLSESESGA